MGSLRSPQLSQIHIPIYDGPLSREQLMKLSTEPRPEGEAPYIEKRIEIMIRLYNPKYGDSRICICGHTYYRHFDGYEDVNCQDVGCKYCCCLDFQEKSDVADD